MTDIDFIEQTFFTFEYRVNVRISFKQGENDSPHIGKMTIICGLSKKTLQHNNKKQ